jgi:hypothetical protein
MAGGEFRFGMRFDEHAPNQKLICAKNQVTYMDTFVAPESHQTRAAPGVQSNFE